MAPAYLLYYILFKVYLIDNFLFYIIINILHILKNKEMGQ